MKIYVKGVAEKTCSPQNIVLNITLATVGKDRENALANGRVMVNEFLLFMQNYNFDVDKFITTSFKVAENFDLKNEKVVKNGFMYRRVLKTEFEYDFEKLKKIIGGASKLQYKPVINVQFGLNDVQMLENEVCAQAFQDAKRQAETIAKAAETILKVCVRTHYDSFKDKLISNTEFVERFDETEVSFSDTEINFVPEDIKLHKEIYCLFEATYKQNEK